MDQDNMNDNYINYTSQGYANVNLMTLSNFFGSLNNNTNSNDEEDNMPPLVSLNTDSLFDTPFMTASNMLNQIQQLQSSMYYNNVNSYISNSNIHPQINNQTMNFVSHNNNYYSNINPQLSGPSMMNQYINQYVNNSTLLLPINNMNLINYMNQNIYPFNMAHQENILGLNNTTMLNIPNLQSMQSMHSSNINIMMNTPPTFQGPTGLQGNTTHFPIGATGTNAPSPMISGATGTHIHAPPIHGASGSNMSVNTNCIIKNNQKLSFGDEDFDFISYCVDKSDLSSGVFYKLRYKNIKLEFILKINSTNGKPIYNKKFLKMIKIIESIMSDVNESDNLRSICNIIYHKDYYISLSIKSKINIVI